MTWFEELTGFAERDAEDVRSNLQLDGTRLKSKANNRSFEAGKFSTPTLASLRNKTRLPATNDHRIRVSEIVGDIRSLHLDPSNASSVFQVASQFNCLEMAAPSVTPEDGVGIYQNDWTQGPACSICAGAGTIYRNYFAEVGGRVGQTHDNQIDCLADVGVLLNNEHRGRNENQGLWKMQNGYCFPSPHGLSFIENYLSNCDDVTLDQIRSQLRVGVQQKTQVTLENQSHLVTQVFCSGLPISYSTIPPKHWNHFPRLILDATYEATFHVALGNMVETNCNKLFLTLVGGGVFGNSLEWILASIGRSLEIFETTSLDVFIVSYRSSKPEVARFISNSKFAN